ncbi:LPS-assembly protein LptD [Chitinimonas sp. BJYL2]|uniref:LPS-assembly protein LptD n=1 Tax=Chitinimonas sp. BJYL2 TaxID=2976696 RepID=UPI0022B3F61C|nr:LPS-assembly protein LptD [Chitinimonas sp. BJYL2]
MSRFRLLQLSLALLCAWQAQADDTGQPAVLLADKVEGEGNTRTRAEGNVQIDTGERRIEADWLELFSQTNDIRAGDRTRVSEGPDIVEGGVLQLNNTTRIGELDAPVYRLGSRQGRGDAVKLLFEGPKHYSMDQARFTTCQVGQDDWFITAGKLELDYTRNIGIARHGTIEFKGVPFLYTPYLDFTLDGSRKSGFLAPSVGKGTGGFEVTVPWYWNIAPNMDATIAPRFISRRGVLLNNEFRYLGQDFNGQLTADIIAKDRLFNDGRSAFSYQHRHTLAPRWSGELNLQKTSDDRYFADFGDRIAVASQTFLPREGSLNYQGNGLHASLRMQRFQTLQDPSNPVAVPYARLPQLTVNYQAPLPAPWTLGVAAEATSFSHPTQIDGKRAVAYPSLSLPWERSWGFITPKLGAHLSRYNLNDGRKLSRNLPIFSVDSGLFFEREGKFLGEDMVQSLEPRAYYVNVPYRDQSAIPVFDSGVADFNFATMFSENQYSGSDRINDANQLTLALTSRLFESGTGIERARFAIGQRFYFDKQRVTLNETARGDKVTASDLIASVGGQPAENWWIDTSVQTDDQRTGTRKAALNLRYQPEAGKLLNLRYRLDKLTKIEQVDVSTQWPVGRNWYVVARQNWSLKDRRSLERLAGVEYNGGCWIFRVVSQRFVTSNNQTSSPFFLQLELNDVGRLGSNPLQTLKESIPGYSKLKTP